jgi:drug/metabolite transporter (DMT)-like permease
VVLAAVVFREHLGRRVLLSAGLVTLAGALLSWEGGAGVDVGAILVVAACVCWGLDNGVTAAIEQLAPEHVVALKGVAAGGTNLAIGLVVGGAAQVPDRGEVLAALAIGAAGYGASITLWVKGARDLGAARAQVIFATAPFVGVAIAWTFLAEDVRTVQLVAVVLAAAGVAVSLRSAHEHAHHHHPMVHDHEHVHDDVHHDVHHSHRHDDGFVGRHAHRHAHVAIVHAHPHVPDLHHRHEH